MVRADVREQALSAGPLHRLTRHRILEDAILRNAEVMQRLGLAFVVLLQVDLHRYPQVIAGEVSPSWVAVIAEASRYRLRSAEERRPDETGSENDAAEVVPEGHR